MPTKFYWAICTWKCSINNTKKRKERKWKGGREAKQPLSTPQSSLIFFQRLVYLSCYCVTGLFAPFFIWCLHWEIDNKKEKKKIIDEQSFCFYLWIFPSVFQSLSRLQRGNFSCLRPQGYITPTLIHDPRSSPAANHPTHNNESKFGWSIGVFFFILSE